MVRGHFVQAGPAAPGVDCKVGEIGHPGRGVREADLDAVEEAADGDVETATVEAKASPPPGEDALMSNVWSDGGWSWRN